MPSYLDDEDFLDALLAYTISDEVFLRKNGHIVKADDFKPQAGQTGGRDRWVIATKALEHWETYREPSRDVILAEIREHARLSKLNTRRKRDLLDYGRKLIEHPKQSVKSVTQKLRDWKLEVIVSNQIEKIMDERGEGKLSTARFMELAREAVSADARLDPKEEDFLVSASIDDRSERRRLRANTRFLPLLIDPLDAAVRAIARGHLGLILAPYKRGKSLMLIHIAIAYTIQRLKVLYITLEDPKEDVEDRFDAAITSIPLKDLATKPNRLKKRMTRFAAAVSGRMRILDRVEEGVSVPEIEQIWLKEAENGFRADAVIVDYDDEITPPRKRSERRHEFADIYRDLRRFAARTNTLVWTACQTQRGTGDIVKLSGDKIAEDISKIRKVACAIGIGAGETEWIQECGEETVHLFVAAHKYDKQNIGISIATDKETARIYDREKTYQVMKKIAVTQAGATANQGGRVR
jgi:hypothetical protein